MQKDDPEYIVQFIKEHRADKKCFRSHSTQSAVLGGTKHHGTATISQYS
ncbi:hypothetical protein OL548_03260 [Lysinibacillus sp. MHQ-1]|nr:hypothetical protein OL548_03260 [Lysinibacillus sp. MHQ-1]